ncbi:MAG: hypothetical protein Q9220_005458 [cf. Caloplaca sp. 1 TL-2023]
MNTADDIRLPPSAETPFPLPSHPGAQDASTMPNLPPTMSSIRSHTADEIIQMMKKTPLFMTDLADAAGDADDDNIALSALKALQYEGTPAEIATSFKERGNEMVAEKKWKDAKEFYTKGILALKHAPQQSSGTQTDVIEKKVENEDVDEEDDERQKEKKVEEACYVNRALCNLELQNYRSTLHDTHRTLLLSPLNLKAHYRSALALLFLSRHSLALDLVSRALTLTSPTTQSTNISAPRSATHIQFQNLRDRILASQRLHDEQEGKRVSIQERKKKEQLALSAAISARGIRVRMSTTAEKAPELEDAVIHLDPEAPLSPTSVLFFPVLVLYPLHAQSDFLKSVKETATWGEVLETVLEGGLQWDTEGEYTVEGVDVFMQTKEGREGGMVKCGRKTRVGDAVKGGRCEVLDGVLRVFVVPKGGVEGWVDGVKRKRGMS